jgi:hypothetical protein
MCNWKKGSDLGMYDGHIFCEEYKDLKNIIVDIINGDDTETNIEEFSEHIQNLYDDGKMSSAQYDDLISYIQDLS